MKRGTWAWSTALVLVVTACTNNGGVAAEPTRISNLTTATVSTASEGYQTCWASDTPGDSGEITLVDDTSGWNLVDALTGMRVHAVAFGDVDGDGAVDMVVGTFATAPRADIYTQRGATGPSPDRLLVQSGDQFGISDSFPAQFGRTSGAVLVDLDQDGDLDLVLSRNATTRQPGAGTTVLENIAGGFEEVSSGIAPEIGGRSVGTVDYDRDGLLDLVIVEDRYTGGSSRLYRNTGNLEFEDVTEASGLPLDVHGLGIVTGDLNADGYADFFIAGSNRLFVGTSDGFAEVPGAIPEWETYGPEDDVAGAAVADVNRDGRLDLVVGQHFNSTLSRGSLIPVRLYLNTTTDQTFSFQDVTVEAGLTGLPTKAPHVELADLDNDGWPDIVTSASAGDGALPAIFHHEGLVDGIPRFASPEGLGSAQYWVTAPVADVNRDGRLDIFAGEWDPGLPSILFLNQTTAGHWIELSVNNEVGGVGTRVEVYEPGRADDPEALVGVREISATVGYTAGIESIAHLGVGQLASVDLVVSEATDGSTTLLSGVPVDRHVRIGGGC